MPLSIDSTDPEVLEAGLEACAASGDGRAAAPILNSVIENNAARVLPLVKRFDCQVVLLVSERLTDGVLERNTATDEAVETARRLLDMARREGFEPAAQKSAARTPESPNLGILRVSRFRCLLSLRWFCCPSLLSLPRREQSRSLVACR